MRRTSFVLHSVAAYQAIALTTLQFVVPVHAGAAGNAPSHLVSNIVLFSLPYLGGFVLAHLIGALIDVTGRLKLFMLGALAAHLVGLSALLFVEKSWAILLASAVAASFTGTLNTTLKTFITRLADQGGGARGAALSRLTQASQLGWMVGGMLAATWLVTVTPAAAHAVIAADVALTVAVMLLVALALPDAKPAARDASHSLLRGIADDLRAVYSEPALVRACLAAIFLVAGNWVFISTFSIFLVDGLNAPASSIGWINVISAVSAFAILPAIGAICDRRGAATAVRLGAFGYVLAYAVLVAHPSMETACFVFCVPAYASLLIGLSSAAAQIGGDARRGGGMGVVDGLWAVAIAIGSAAGGFVADHGLEKIPMVALGVTVAGLAAALAAATALSVRLSPLATGTDRR